MNIKIADIEYKIAICAEHEDDASPKTVKEIVQQKAEEIERIKEMAAKYGMTLSGKEESSPQPQKTAAQPSGHKNIHPGLKRQPIARQEAPELSEPPAEQFEQPLQEDAGETANVERYNEYETRKDGVPRITAQKSQVVKTESGREVVVPSILYDDVGTKTSIRIVNTGGDRALQSRFKEMADASKGNRGPDFRNQYGIRDCVACNGTGRSRINKNNPCPKCGGDGFFK